MRKTILSMIFLSTIIGLSGQTKITGFGKLRLGDSISIVNEMGYDVETVTKDNDYFSKVYKNSRATKIYELVADSTEERPVTGSSLDLRVRVFAAPKYSVTDNIEIKSVQLKFFKNRLIEINCDGDSKLEEALTLKYGEPKKNLKEKENKFTYTYTGNTVTKTDQTFTSEWTTNDKNISCTSVLSKWYSSKGEASYLSYINLADNSHNEDIRKTEEAVKERLKNRELLKKKESLNGF